jgi:phosphate transport system permease protein
MPPEPATPNPRPFVIAKTRTRFFGLTLDETIKGFFGGNALTAVIVLALITIFLFREGADFFGQNRESITLYRRAGLEYVDLMRQQQDDHTALTRYLFDIRMQAVRHYTETAGLPLAEANARLAAFDDYAGRYSDAVEPIRGFVSELTDVAVEIKTKYRINEDAKIERQQFLAAGMQAEADAVRIIEIDFKAELAPLVGVTPAYLATTEEFAAALTGLVASAPELPTPELQRRIARFQELNREYLATFPATRQRLEAWDATKPVPFYENITGVHLRPAVADGQLLAGLVRRAFRCSWAR